MMRNERQSVFHVLGKAKSQSKEGKPSRRKLQPLALTAGEKNDEAAQNAYSKTAPAIRTS
ncbi:MAG: hypothetical protein LBB65_01435 [Burkholderiales bacterium]|nr:hypothetical protein [Burkholderiales bacterium]